MRRLERTLKTLDGRGYKAYKEIQGSYEHPRLSLSVDHVQGDPFAAPSRLRAVLSWQVADLPPGARASAPRERAAWDFIARTFRRVARRERDVTIDAGGQTVLERSACLFTEEGVERLVSLGRSPNGRLEPVAALAAALARLSDGGWDDLSGHPDGDLALPRLQEVMAALSRLRGVGLGR